MTPIEDIKPGALGIQNLSASAYDQFRRCPAQWAMVRLEGRRLPPGIAAHIGTGLHGAAEVSMRQKIISGVDLPSNDLADAATTAYRARVEKEGVFLPREDRAEVGRLVAEGLDRTVVLAREWGAQVAPAYRPAAVEERLIYQGPELPIPWVGVLDLRTADRCVADWKQAAKRWPAGREAAETQPTVYRQLVAHEQGAPPAEMAFEVLIHRKNGAERDRRTTERTDEDWAALQRGAAIMLRMVAAGLFPPADPGAWQCSEKWCGFWGTCPHISERRRRLPNV
jgi:hypothetical protein